MKKNPVLIAVVIVVLCVVGILLLKDKGSLKTLQQGQSHSLKVSAKKDWVSTGLTIDAGTKILIETDGQWSHGSQGNSVPFYGPEGYDKKDSQVILPDANVGALVGRVASSNVFLIGQSPSLTASQSGELFLAINEVSGSVSHDNNDGELKVTIRRQ